MNGMVLQAQDVPARFRLPRRALELLLREEVGAWRKMRGPDELLLFLGKVATEKLRAIRKHPDVAVSELNTREDIRGILVQLVLNCLADIRRNCADVDEAGHAIVDARSGDGRTAIGVPD